MNCGGEPECNLYLLEQNSSEKGHEGDWKTGNLPSSRVSHKPVRMLSIDGWRDGSQSLHLNLCIGEMEGGTKEGMRWDLTCRNSLSSWGG